MISAPGSSPIFSMIVLQYLQVRAIKSETPFFPSSLSAAYTGTPRALRDHSGFQSI